MSPETSISAGTTLLAISPEAVLPPGHGGALRTTSLLLGMARQFSITVVVPQPEIEILQALQDDPSLGLIRWVSAFPSGRKHRSIATKVRGRWNNWLERRRRAEWTGICRDWAFVELSSWYEILRELLDELHPEVVLIEHTRHAATLEWIKQRDPRIFAVVNSQNVESELARQLMPPSVGRQKQLVAVEKIESYERKLSEWCDLLWCCSQSDLERYLELGVRCRNTGVVPNGVDTKSVSFQSSSNVESSNSLLFVGTLCYEPNEQGVLWFYCNVWPDIKLARPQTTWKIIGRFPTPAIEAIANADPAIELHPNVPSTLPYLHNATVGICPLFSGSGTRLKLLEAFSAGLPMVSTTLGAEGLNAVDGVHLKLADDPTSFARAVVSLLQAPEDSRTIAENARALVEEQYDWISIAEKASEQLMLLHPPMYDSA
jgi:glycosyltransferase involved in cell wall biosynthesis